MLGIAFEAPDCGICNILLNLPDRRPVRALHVVRIDLQLRLRIDLRIVVQQQVAIRLLGTCLLRVLVDQNPP